MIISRHVLCLVLAAPVLAGCGNIPRPQFFNPFARPAPVVYVVPLEQPVEAPPPAPAAPSAPPRPAPASVRVEEPDRRTPRVIITDEFDRRRSGEPTLDGDGGEPDLVPPLPAPQVVAPPPATQPRDTGRRVPEPARIERARPTSQPRVTPQVTPDDPTNGLPRLRHRQGHGFDVL